jgi:molecular chaperone DnaK (HSP70)
MSIDPNSSQGPIIGIDFGTTKTMVAEYDPVKKSAKVHKLGRGGDEMPTSIYVTEEGDVLFGDDADDEGVLDSPNHIRRFKMLLGRPTDTPFGTKSVTPIELAAEFLGHVRKRLEHEVFHRPVERLVLTVPAMFGPAQRKDLITAAGRAGFKSVELLAEPVAAGIAYCDHNTDLSTNLRFLVVDWGGGTFDLALVERNGMDECKVLGGLVDGCADIGGEDLDDELWGAVDGRVTGAGFQSLGNQPKHEWGKYRRELTRAKEGLTARSQLTINFTVDSGKLVRIPFSRTELEEVIAEKVQIGARQVADLVERCRKNGFPPDFLLLAGGTSRIPMIAKVLEQVSGLPCRAWSEGRDAIALGAAIHANRILERPTSKPAPPPTIEPDHKASAVAQYTSFLEGAWIDGVISDDKRVFLSKKSNELGLTIDEANAIQINVLGAPISDFVNACSNKTREINNARKKIINTIKERKFGNERQGASCIITNAKGTYKGSCKNQTVKPYESAALSFLIERQEGNYISGVLDIEGPLTGGSRFSGSLNGDRLNIETSGGGFHIFWTGSLIDRGINGTYRATAVSMLAKLIGPKEQNGVWECRRIN